MPIYILKRLLHMIPILAGVILLTFILFNVVGGSPAAVVLGKNASARALEEFDEQRGYNKPLLFSRWTTTRALSDTLPVSGKAPLTDLTAEAWPVPLAFGLRPHTGYRLCALTDGKGEVTLSVAGARIDPVVSSQDGFTQLEFSFTTGDAPSEEDLRLVAPDGPVALLGTTLRRRMASPFDSQLVYYLRQLARLDFGVSSQTNQRVADILREGVRPSLSLTIPIFTGSLLFALVFGLLCACHRDRWLDRSLVVAATVLMSVNYVVWVVAGQYLLAFRLQWFPIWGYESWRFLLLPVMIGMVTGLGRDLRFYRTVMLDEMYRDYVRTARAKGISTARILFRHVLRNALIPVITSVSLSLPFLFTGSLLLERFYGIPGLGGTSINAIHSSDVDVVRAVVLIGAILYAGVNLLTDIAYAWVDPRIRLR